MKMLRRERESLVFETVINKKVGSNTHACTPVTVPTQCPKKLSMFKLQFKHRTNKNTFLSKIINYFTIITIVYKSYFNY